MKQEEYNIYEIDDKREAKLWNEAIIVFDTSSLLEIYFCSDKYKKTIVKILLGMEKRLWLPHQVLYEYHKNRKRTILKPINEKYKKKDIKSDFKCIDSIIEETKDHEFHPFISDKALKKITELNKEIQDRVSEIESQITTEYDNRCKEIEDSIDPDIVLNAVKRLKHGNGFKYDQILEIIKEGELRYRNQIPPGYMDATGQKEGLQIYGDLIIWKEIIEFAVSVKKPILFICDDIKIDWAYKDNKQRNRITAPREELIKEIYDFSKSEFWMYTLRQFIHNYEKYQAKPDDNNQISEILSFMDKQVNKRPVRRIITTETNPDILIYECSNCKAINRVHRDMIDFDFECVDGQERSMGPENHYLATQFVECNNCDEDIQIDFNIWEYPVGAINYKETDIEGGHLIKDIDYSIDLHDRPEPEEYDIN